MGTVHEIGTLVDFASKYGQLPISIILLALFTYVTFYLIRIIPDSMARLEISIRDLSEVINTVLREQESSHHKEFSSTVKELSKYVGDFRAEISGLSAQVNSLSSNLLILMSHKTDN